MRSDMLVRVRLAGLVSSLLIVLTVTVSTAATAAAHGADQSLHLQRTQTNTLQLVRSTKADCFHRRVVLDGNRVVSNICALKDKPSGQGPYAVIQGDCQYTDVQLFEDAQYGAAEICFYQGGASGSVNLTDYPVNIFINWNDRVSSWKSGNFWGSLSWDINGGGARYPFSDHMLCPWIGSHWNDQASWLSIGGTGSNSQIYC